MGYGRKMDGCGQFMKYSMFIINFITFIGGFILLGIGIWMLVDKSHINELLGTNLLIGAVYIMIVTGALVTIISCFGCIGSSREVRCMLLMYFFIVFVIFVTMLVGGILGFVFRKTVSDTMEQEMISSLRWYKSKRIVKEAWDDTQQRLECCGVKNYLDWLDEIPNSCCREPIPGKISGLTLTVATCFTVISLRAPLFLINNGFFLSFSCFLFTSGILCFASSWLTWSSRKTFNGNNLLALIILILSISMIMLIVGTGMGVTYRTNFSFDWYTKKVHAKNDFYSGYMYSKLQKGFYRDAFNRSLTQSFIFYDIKTLTKIYWDSMQENFQCCGIEHPSDWYKIRTFIPLSCVDQDYYPTEENMNSIEVTSSDFERLRDYNQNGQENPIILYSDIKYKEYNFVEESYSTSFVNVYPQDSSLKLAFQEGCLDVISFSIAWCTSFIAGFGFIVLFVNLFTISTFFFIYLKHRSRQITSNEIQLNNTVVNQSQPSAPPTSPIQISHI